MEEEDKYWTDQSEWRNRKKINRAHRKSVKKFESPEKQQQLYNLIFHNEYIAQNITSDMAYGMKNKRIGWPQFKGGRHLWKIVPVE
jgi:hypothetical protein